MENDVIAAETVPAADDHRRRAAHFYGLIVSGAVLATAPDDFRLVRVAIILLGTLLIYFAAETYVNWLAARSVVRRDLTAAERRQIVLDGWPLVTACVVPVVFLALEAIAGVDTSLALDLALALNAALLFHVGWRMGRAEELSGGRLALSVVAPGLLGVALIALKTLTHH
jgi:hypothetical protein